MAKKQIKEKSIEEALWESANKLRGSVEPSEYKHVVLSLIFLKYANDRFIERRNQLIVDGKAAFADNPVFYNAKNVFYLEPESRWDYLIENSKQNDIAIKIDKALARVEQSNPTLKGALPSNYYAGLALDRTKLAALLDEINKIDTLKDPENDLIGRVYEYFLGKFAIAEGKGKGEYYTPKTIVNLIAEMIEPYRGKIYDPCCGSGGMFVQSVAYLAGHRALRRGVSIFGQEANADTWRMAKMNMAVRGIHANFGPYNADTFTNDLFENTKFDFILANPPFNLKKWGQEQLKDDVRWNYGLPPAGNANYAWIQHMIHHLAPGGKIGLVLANGSLTSNQSGEGEIRRRIVEDDLVEGIVALPTQLFYSVQIPVCLWFISKDKPQPGKTLFVDARQLGHMVDRTHRDFDEADIGKIAGAMRAFQEGSFEPERGFSAVATTEEIAAQGGVLTPGRYVGTPEEEGDGEPFGEKMKRLTADLAKLFSESSTLEDKILTNLKAIGYEL
jgi:type I restriction enzyme M protein